MSLKLQLRNEIGELDCNGCSPFFFTSAMISIANAFLRRHDTISSIAEDDKNLSSSLVDAEFHEDRLDKLDRETKLKLRDQRRNFTRKESYERLETDLLKNEIKMLIEDWPLQLTIKAMNEKRQTIPTGILPISLVLGKHSKAGATDPLSLSYNDIVDQVKNLLVQQGFNETNIYRFKAENRISGGPAVAYTYALMNNLPTIFIIPRVYKYSISIYVNIWNQDSVFPFQYKAFSIDCEQMKMFSDANYQQSKVNELVNALASIAIVINDSYTLCEGGEKLRFYEFAMMQEIGHKYPYLVEYAMKEYRSLLDPTQASVELNGHVYDAVEHLSKNGRKGIEQIISHALDNLSQSIQ